MRFQANSRLRGVGSTPLRHRCERRSVRTIQDAVVGGVSSLRFRRLDVARSRAPRRRRERHLRDDGHKARRRTIMAKKRFVSSRGDFRFRFQQQGGARSDVLAHPRRTRQGMDGTTMNRMNLAAATGVLAVGLWQTPFASSAPSLDMRPRDPVQTSGVFPDVSERSTSDAKAAETEGAAYFRGATRAWNNLALGRWTLKRLSLARTNERASTRRKSNVGTSG